MTLFDRFTNPIYVFFGLANGVCLDDAGRQSSRIRRVTLALPALMLLRDLASKDWNRREWASISRSKSSLSLGASNTAAALPLRVIMTGPSFCAFVYISTEMGFHVRERCDLHNSNSCPPINNRLPFFTPIAKTETVFSS